MKISIITPNYNYAQYIGKTIRSVMTQDYDNIEHIIVDDGSTDNSVEIIKDFQTKYPNKIKLIQQENKGQTPALNVALSHVTGDVVCWLNSDDYFFSKDIFTSIISEFENSKNDDAIFGNIAIIDKNDKILRYKKYFNFSFAAGVFVGFGRIMSSNAIFWKKDIMQGIWFNEEFTYSMDADFFSRLLYKKRIKHIDKIIAVFRWHKDAKTYKVKRDKKTIEEANYQKIKTTLVAYDKLLISRIISFKFYFLFRIFFRLYRFILKVVYGWRNYK